MQRLQRGELIALAQTDTDGVKTNHSLTIQVLRAGDFVDMHGKPLQVTDVDLETYASRSNTLLASEQVPIEIGHPEDPGAPAAAWYKRFFTKVVDGVKWLCADVELSALGAASLADRLYKYFSAKLDLDSAVVIGGGFVNRPAVSGQQVVGSLAAYLHPKGKASMPQSNWLAALKRWLHIAELEMSQEDTQRALWEALRDKYGDPLDEYGVATPWLVATYSDHAIVSKESQYFSIPYSFDGDGKAVLGDPVEVEITYTPKTASDANLSARPAVNNAAAQGGTEMTDAEVQAKVEAARKEEREKALLAQADADKKIELARKEERERVLAEQERKGKIATFAQKVTLGKRALPTKPEELVALLDATPDTVRPQWEALLGKIAEAGTVDLSELGSSADGGAKQLPVYAKRLLSEWVSKKKTVAEFFEANPELGEMVQYNLAEFAGANGNGQGK